MRVNGIKEREGTLRTLKSLLEDSNRKVHGVFYDNSFFSQRYLCRNHLLTNAINLKDNTVELTAVTRLEGTGLLEIENTLDMLVRHEAGDIPGFTPEGIYNTPVDRPSIPEQISVTQQLYSVDVMLIMDNPNVTYQEFTIAGCKFTLVNLTHKLEEDFEQKVTILFGDARKLYFFSHFSNKKLTVRDMMLILDLIIDENISGKAIQGVSLTSQAGTSSSLFPMEELISSYRTITKDIVFSAGTGYIKILSTKLPKYKMECTPTPNSRGGYVISLTNNKESIDIFME